MKISMQLQRHSWTLWSLPLTKHNHSYNSVSVFHMLDTTNIFQISAYHLPASSALLERVIKVKTLGHSLLRSQMNLLWWQATQVQISTCKVEVATMVTLIKAFYLKSLIVSISPNILVCIAFSSLYGVNQMCLLDLKWLLWRKDWLNLHFPKFSPMIFAPTI